MYLPSILCLNANCFYSFCDASEPTNFSNWDSQSQALHKQFNQTFSVSCHYSDLILILTLIEICSQRFFSIAVHTRKATLGPWLICRFHCIRTVKRKVNYQPLFLTSEFSVSSICRIWMTGMPLTYINRVMGSRAAESWKSLMMCCNVPNTSP